jgi:hypothetical protein
MFLQAYSNIIMLRLLLFAWLLPLAACVSPDPDPDPDQSDGCAAWAWQGECDNVSYLLYLLLFF